MRKFLEKTLDWSLSSVVGNVAWLGLTGLVTWALGERTGLLVTVIEFAGEHAREFAAWTVFAAIIGAAIGVFVRHRIALRQLSAKDARIAGLRKRPTKEDVDELRCQLSAYEDERARMVEAVRNYPFFRREALRYACTRSGVFTVERDSRLSSELEVLKEEGLVRKTHQWGNCAEWTTTEKGESAWRDYTSEWGETVSSTDQLAFQADTLGTRAYELRHLDTWAEQAVLFVYDHPHQRCSEQYRDTLFASIPGWAYKFSFADGTFDLTPDAARVIDETGMDEGRRLYESVVRDKAPDRTALDAIAIKIEIDCALRGVHPDGSVI